MLLHELFKDSKRVLPWKIIHRREHNQVYQFPFERGMYYVDFNLLGDGSWEIQFEYDSPEHAGAQEIIDTKGGAIVILSTIVNIVRNFIDEQKPERLTFHAKEPSRQKVYRRLAKMVGGDVEELRSSKGTMFKVTVS